MSITFQPVETLFTSGKTLYFIIRGFVAGVRQVWNPTLNTGAGGWEVYNAAHWAQYAIAMTEDAGSGYYAGVYPGAAIYAAAAGGPVLTTEVVYEQGGASPLITDAPASGIGQSQGSNVGSIAGNAQDALNLDASAGFAMMGAFSGTPTGQVLPTTLTVAQALAAVGGALLVTSGVAVNCRGRVISASGSTLTLAAPLPATPAAADLFTVV